MYFVFHFNILPYVVAARVIKLKSAVVNIATNIKKSVLNSSFNSIFIIINAFIKHAHTKNMHSPIAKTKILVFNNFSI